MRLLRTIGGTPEIALGDDAQRKLVTEAYRFLLAGGTVTLGEWADLEPCEREALAEAGLLVRRETAAAIGLASRSEEVAVNLASDGGELAKAYAERKRRAALEASAERALGGQKVFTGAPHVNGVNR